mgnify:CR=1 FL=1
MRKNTEQRILLGVSKIPWENAAKISLENLKSIYNDKLLYNDKSAILLNRNEEEKKRMFDWNLTAKTIMSVHEWVIFFNEIGYTGDYYWFIP